MADENDTESLSPPADASPAQASELVGACEAAWAAIQERHPGVPDAVIVLGSGVERGRLVKLGHWWSGRWIADGQVRGEVLLAGEALHLKPDDVFEVLLHEAAHGLNANRGVKDTSRGGRYHNSRFRHTAEEFGLNVTMAPPFGWASTSLPETSVERYRSEIAGIGEAMRLARRVAGNRLVSVKGSSTGAATETEPGDSEASGAKNPAAQCGCGRKMRMAPSTLAAGPVFCGLCSSEFTTTPKQQHAALSDGFSSEDNGHRTSLDRRRRALEATAPVKHDAVTDPGLPFRGHAPVEAEALRLLAVATGSPEGVASLAAAGAWCHARGQGVEEAIVAADYVEAAACNHVTRALLKLDRTLSGEAIQLAGREWMTGDRLIVGRHTHELLDADGEPIPPPGVPGVVGNVDSESGTIVVDFPIYGTNRFATWTTAAALDYGYATIAADAGAPHIDLRLLDLSPGPPMRDGAEIEP